MNGNTVVGHFKPMSVVTVMGIMQSKVDYIDSAGQAKHDGRGIGITLEANVIMVTNVEDETGKGFI